MVMVLEFHATIIQKEHAKNQNHLAISIYTNEFANWLANKAYK